jgi:hypothetical protein
MAVNGDSLPSVLLVGEPPVSAAGRWQICSVIDR